MSEEKEQSQPTETVVVEPTENAIPQSRFKEVNDQKKEALDRAVEAETKLAEMEEAQTKAEEDRKVKQGEFETLYTEQKDTNAEQSKELARYEELEKQRWQLIADSIPEEKKKFFPDGDDKETIRANLSKFQEWTDAGIFTGLDSTPNPDMRGPVPAHMKSGKVGPDEKGRYYPSELEFSRANPGGFDTYLVNRTLKKNQPIGSFKGINTQTTGVDGETAGGTVII